MPVSSRPSTLRRALGVGLLATALSGCAALGPPGLLFTGVKGPGRIDTGATTNLGAAVISGEACASSVLGLVAWGDWSVDAALRAAQAGGRTLKNVSVDHRVLSILLGVYANYCTRVTAQVAQ
jgi:hypothetical protein